MKRTEPRWIESLLTPCHLELTRRGLVNLKRSHCPDRRLRTNSLRGLPQPLSASLFGDNADREEDQVFMVICNDGDSIYFSVVEVNGDIKTKDVSTFPKEVTAIDVRSFRASNGDTEILVAAGFQDGEATIMNPFDGEAPISMKINAKGKFCSQSITRICWSPQENYRLLLAFKNGFLMHYDTRYRAENLSILVGFEEKAADGHAHSKVIRFHIWSMTAQVTLKKVQDAVHCNPLWISWVSRGAITEIQFHPDKRIVGITNVDGILALLRSDTGQLIRSFESWFGAFRCMRFSPDGRIALVGGEDNGISALDLRKGEVIAFFEGHLSLGFFLAACKYPYYRFFSVSEDGMLGAWEFVVKEAHKRDDLPSPTEDADFIADFPGAAPCKKITREFIPCFAPLLLNELHQPSILDFDLIGSFMVLFNEDGSLVTWRVDQVWES